MIPYNDLQKKISEISNVLKNLNLIYIIPENIVEISLERIERIQPSWISFGMAPPSPIDYTLKYRTFDNVDVVAKFTYYPLEGEVR